MYLSSAEDALLTVRALKRAARGLSGVDIAVAVPMAFLVKVAEALESSPIRVGAQAISAFEGGAHTGEVSAAMAQSVGASFAIIGHSERRALGEADASVRDQIVQAAHAGLRPVLCVGELERTPDGAHVSFVETQLREALRGAQSLSSRLIVAYEPVWAIGKRADLAPKPAEVREMVIFIRKTLADILGRTLALKVPVLYGGAVEPENAHALAQEGDVAGFLVGHESVTVDHFVAIAEACKK